MTEGDLFYANGRYWVKAPGNSEYYDYTYNRTMEYLREYEGFTYEQAKAFLEELKGEME